MVGKRVNSCGSSCLKALNQNSWQEGIGFTIIDPITQVSRNLRLSMGICVI
ncbi:MAG: hypothetical protein ACLT1K_07575 [[Clostridium] leptum]